MKHIAGIQNLYDKKGAMKKCLPHLATRCEDVAKEVLGFLCIMLFNANTSVQVNFPKRFLLIMELNATCTIRWIKKFAILFVDEKYRIPIHSLRYSESWVLCFSASDVRLFSVNKRRSVLHGCSRSHGFINEFYQRKVRNLKYKSRDFSFNLSPLVTKFISPS